ncbi:hypothetical protein PMIN06_000829 [Paraphaeosphaeria minitans]
MAPTLAFLVSLLSLPLLSHALPTTPALPKTWTLTNFTLILSPAQNSTSISFTFTDRSPAFPTILTCTSNTTLRTQACGPRRDVLWKVSEDLGEVVLRRQMSLNSTNMGTARQATHWVDGVNVTETGAGRQYAKAEDWLFTVSSVSG